MSSTKASFALLALAVWTDGCSAESHARRAENTARRILAERDAEVLGARTAEVKFPEPRPPEPELEPAEDVLEEPLPESEPVAPAAQVLDLRQALAVAYRSGRDMIDRQEVLQVQALSLANSRHEFAPQLALALSYLFDDPEGPDTNSSGALFTASQILPTGARLDLAAATDVSATEGDSGVYDSLVSLSLAQPLLRGGGYAVTHEPLIQAERNLVYALREFELFREDFSIDVARRFYDLVNRKQTIENQRRNFESNEFARRSAEALFAVGRASELDVLRARRSELTAKNDLLEAEEGLQLALDTFRIFLGLPQNEKVDVQPDPPVFTPVEYDVDSAVQVALENRLDRMNRIEQIEDVERTLAISRNALLPDLDVVLGASFATDPSDSFGGSDLDRSDASVAVTLGVPLDRVRERNAYRTAEIALGRARRDFEEFDDQLVVSIQSSFREVARRLESLAIQEQLIVDQTKNKRIAELRFEKGDIPNRDVVEANQSLLDAQNALIDEQVSYEIERLQLLRDLGILFIDEEGMWKR